MGITNVNPEKNNFGIKQVQVATGVKRSGVAGSGTAMRIVFETNSEQELAKRRESLLKALDLPNPVETTESALEIGGDLNRALASLERTKALQAEELHGVKKDVEHMKSLPGGGRTAA